MSAVQGSIEWLQERLGCATASRFGDILATTKSGPSASRKNYLTQLVLERITGTVEESYSNTAMQWGTDTEPLARAAFEAETGLIVQETGFVRVGEWCGFSPDGYIGADEGWEAKCPNSATHMETLIAKEMPSKHIPQVQGSLWLSQRERWHFVSFDPRFPPKLRLFHQVIERDEAYIAKLETEVNKFLAEVAEAVKKLEAM